MAYLVMACIAMAGGLRRSYTVMAYIVLAYIRMADGGVEIGRRSRGDVVTAYTVMAYIVVACTVMAGGARRNDGAV